MQFWGGKSRAARHIAKVIVDSTTDGLPYWEPFVGGASVAVAYGKLRPKQFMLLTDTSPDLILMWQALQLGWQPPRQVSEEEYQIVRREEPSALRGFVGYGQSFGGKFFGGYARARTLAHGYANEAVNALAKKVPHISHAFYGRKDYREVQLPSPFIIYADPPYMGKTGYKQPFDSEEFWNWCRETSKTHHLFISEYEAPADFACVWEREHTRGARSAIDGKSEKVMERLFVHEG